LLPVVILSQSSATLYTVLAADCNHYFHHSTVVLIREQKN